MPATGAFVGQPGVVEVVPGVVGQGDDTPPRVVPFVVAGLAVPANGFDDDACPLTVPIVWSAVARKLLPAF